VKKNHHVLKNKRLNSSFNTRIICTRIEQQQEYSGIHSGDLIFLAVDTHRRKWHAAGLGGLIRMMKNFHSKKTATQYFS
jgi:hypothetical protein